MKWFLVILSIVIQGCSNLPVEIKEPPARNLKYNEVIENISKYQGMPLRWGGSIIEVENEEKLTRIQVLYHPLDSDGRPELSQSAEGRFMLESTKFLDPAIYRRDAEITVAGTLIGETIQKVGKKELKIPVISAEVLHLWPDRYNRAYRDYGYPPFYYYGTYPYGFYGYYRSPYLYFPWY